MWFREVHELQQRGLAVRTGQANELVMGSALDESPAFAEAADAATEAALDATDAALDAALDTAPEAPHAESRGSSATAVTMASPRGTSSCIDMEHLLGNQSRP